MSLVSDRGWELSNITTCVYIEDAVFCSMLYNFSFLTSFQQVYMSFFFFFHKEHIFSWDQMFTKLCSFTVSFDYNNSVVYSPHTALLLQVFKQSSDKRVFLSLFEWEVKYPKISQIFLSHLLAAVPWPILPSPWQLHPLLTFGGGMDCAREGRLVSAWAAAFLHLTPSGCGAASPHWCCHSPAWAKGSATGEMSCSLSLSYGWPPRNAHRGLPNKHDQEVQSHLQY